MRNFGMYDVSLRLRNSADGAETSTAAEAAIELDVLAIQAFKCLINVISVDNTTGDETYTFDVQVATTSGGTYYTVGSFVFAAGTCATGEYEIPLSGQNIYEHLSTAAYIRIKATLGGTTPSVNYGAVLTRLP